MTSELRTDDPKKLDDKRLIVRIAEFRSAQAACQRELSKLVSEYQGRRIERVRAGEPPERAGEAGTLVGGELSDALRREQIAAQHREADEAAMHDPRSRTLLVC